MTSNRTNDRTLACIMKKNKKKIDRESAYLYLRGVKSSYLLDVVPSQRRVITFVLT